MHMSDALVSPIVGGTMLATSALLATYSVKRVKLELEEQKIPLMGVMGAFIFAAQMINFTIPATGSSGHIGGGLLLAIMLGPYAGFLAMLSVLLIQALFFADGGLLAFGANVFNLGFYTCFLAYPFIYKKILSKGYSTKKIFLASIISALVGLQLGAFSVVLETVLSGKTLLPFSTFLGFMQPIHLAIGLVEGLVTAMVVSFVYKARPEILEHPLSGQVEGKMPLKNVILVFLVVAVLTGGVLSWFASSNPDGLEWAILKAMGEKSAEISKSNEEVINIGGLLGTGVTLILLFAIGVIIKFVKKRMEKNV